MDCMGDAFCLYGHGQYMDHKIVQDFYVDFARISALWFIRFYCNAWTWKFETKRLRRNGNLFFGQGQALVRIFFLVNTQLFKIFKHCCGVSVLGLSSKVRPGNIRLTDRLQENIQALGKTSASMHFLQEGRCNKNPINFSMLENQEL